MQNTGELSLRLASQRRDANSSRVLCTCAQAGERKGELAHKLVLGGVLVVLHDEAHQGQLGDLQLEAQGAVPARVEACRGRMRAVSRHTVEPSAFSQWTNCFPTAVWFIPMSIKRR